MRTEPLTGRERDVRVKSDEDTGDRADCLKMGAGVLRVKVKSEM